LKIPASQTQVPAPPAINYLTNGAGHQYNGFTAEMKRRGPRA
jgi:hypothetical protein